MNSTLLYVISSSTVFVYINDANRETALSRGVIVLALTFCYIKDEPLHSTGRGFVCFHTTCDVTKKLFTHGLFRKLLKKCRHKELFRQIQAIVL